MRDSCARRFVLCAAVALLLTGTSCVHRYERLRIDTVIEEGRLHDARRLLVELLAETESTEDRARLQSLDNQLASAHYERGPRQTPGC